MGRGNSVCVGGAWCTVMSTIEFGSSDPAGGDQHHASASCVTFSAHTRQAQPRAEQRTKKPPWTRESLPLFRWKRSTRRRRAARRALQGRASAPTSATWQSSLVTSCPSTCKRHRRSSHALGPPQFTRAGPHDLVLESPEPGYEARRAHRTRAHDVTCTTTSPLVKRCVLYAGPPKRSASICAQRTEPGSRPPPPPPPRSRNRAVRGRGREGGRGRVPVRRYRGAVRRGRGRRWGARERRTSDLYGAGERCASDLYRAGERCASDLYGAGERCASDLYGAGERCASDLYGAGKRCASDLYGGRGGVADLAACEHEPDGRLVAVRPLRPPRGERRARRGCAPVVGAVGCAVGLAFSLERSTAMTSRAITSWRATDVSCAGADASSRQCGEERQNSRAGVERRIVPGCMRDAERLSSARCLGAIWDFASGDQCRRHVGRASGPLSRCWNRRDSMQSREGSWPLLLGLPQHTS